MSMLETALTAAEQGYYVFPLRPGTKLPFAGSKWKEEATNDPDLVAFAWAEHPNANVGLATGRGILVLDLDRKGSKDGVQSVASIDPSLALDLDLGTAAGRVVLTPSGGLHVYYRVDGEVGNTSGTLGDGIDTRGDGGYVLAPGSVIDGVKYELLSDGPPQPAPHWVSAPKVAPVKAVVAETQDIPASVAWAEKFVADYPIVTEGNGSDAATFRLFATLRDHGISEETALRITELWAELCGFDRDWVEGKAENAYHYAKNDPGCRDAVADLLAACAADANSTQPEAPAEKKPNRFAAMAIAGGAIDDMPLPRWQFKKLVEANSLNLIRGGYGTKKTFIALDLSLSAAIGQGWAGHECAGEQTVVYCAGEGSFGMRSRIKAWTHSKNGGHMPAGFTLLPSVPLAADPDDWAAFVEFVAERRPDMIFLDTVSRTMAGLDEMSARDMAVFVERCAVLQRLGSTVFLIHHEGKDKARGSRGSTVLPASVDLELAVEIEDGVAKVTTAKVKNAEEWQAPKVFRHTLVRFDGSEDGASLVLTCGDAPPAEHKQVKQTAAVVSGLDTLSSEIHAVLYNVAVASPDNRSRGATDIARLVYAAREAAGTEKRREAEAGRARETEATRKAIERMAKGAMPEQLRGCYDPVLGWGYWGSLT